MSDQTPEVVEVEEKRTRPFADFLAEHNNGHGHRRASTSLQDVVNAVVETGKKGSVTVTVSVEPMKSADDGTLMLTVTVAEKIPSEPVKAAIFYADDEGNLTRTDPRQAAFDFQSLREVEKTAGELREAPAKAAPRRIGGDS